MLSQRREVELEFRSVRLKLVVQSLSAEVDLRVARYVKQRCAGNSLTGLDFETAVGGDFGEDTLGAELAVLRPFLAARLGFCLSPAGRTRRCLWPSPHRRRGAVRVSSPTCLDCVRSWLRSTGVSA